VEVFPIIVDRLCCNAKWEVGTLSQHLDKKTASKFSCCEVQTHQAVPRREGFSRHRERRAGGAM
jgi:hypothetical protein